MRQVLNPQYEFGQVDISKIKFNLKSRDDIPRILRGLQYIYVTDSIRKPIFELLEKEVSPHINKRNGRPGMELWKILVLGVLKLDLNCDYDRLESLANSHIELREMLGHTYFVDRSNYKVHTLKDNVSLLSAELLVKINEIIVNGGHELAQKKSVKPALHGRCDSFVVETNVHYPTDTNLLLDAMRKVLYLGADLCEKYGLSDLRQYRFNYKQLKRLQMKVQKSRKYKGAEDKLKSVHQEYLKHSLLQLNKVSEVLSNIVGNFNFSITDTVMVDEINNFKEHALRQIDQIERRVIHGEVIPHSEKVFSIFEPHTEWISKGKAGVPVELGLRVCILEDQYQFILHHHVMERQTDDKVAVLMAKTSKDKFPNLTSVSYDKGFHSQENQDELNTFLDLVALPRKGRLSKINQEIEHSPEFRRARKKHSAVESAINGLEVHGLDICLDKGINGFKRYVALAIVTRNIHRIGDILYKQDTKAKLKQDRKIRLASNSPNLRQIA